uniref:Torsin-1A C-terminal domain-containing protein n=1 Tax=Leptobrachium leishanense TaxID=445787 RepID=A0A8C5PS70_9ANUR
MDEALPLVLLCALLHAAPVTPDLHPLWIAVGIGGYITWRWRISPGEESCDLQGEINVTALQEDLEKRVFGQHLAKGITLRALSGFLRNENPRKTLAISFHGSTGTGKNYISQIIGRHMYPEGMNSSCVNQFVATLHFPHVQHLDMYKVQLWEWIRGNVTACKRSIFIFDEVDKMHPGLIDAIEPYLDYYEHIDKLACRKAIFIFLSNTAGDVIFKLALDFWKAGKVREDIKLSDVERQLSLSAFNKINGGFWHSSFMERNLIDFYVPFLPLEQQHVRICIKREIMDRGLIVDEELVSKVANDMTYYPTDEQVFSLRGCKVVSTKLDFYLLPTIDVPVDRPWFLNFFWCVDWYIWGVCLLLLIFYITKRIFRVVVSLWFSFWRRLLIF